MFTTALFFVGFGLLVKGADRLVSGASSIARTLGVSPLVIGLTIVAFGTSAPELTVNLLASIEGNTDIAIGNVIGSNIVNILLILGICALIYPLAINVGTVWKEIPFALLAVVLMGIMANDVWLDGASISVLSRIDGLVLINFFAIFLYSIFSVAASSDASSVETPEHYSTTMSAVRIAGGLVGLVIGGKWIVDGAVVFATQLGVSEALIGLTIVAVGTSLPELATSVVATYKKHIDIAVGNVVGSNIFNVFWILGMSSVLTPLPFSQALSVDVWVVIGATAALFLALFVGRKHMLERWQGAVFVALYVAYVVYAVMRG